MTLFALCVTASILHPLSPTCIQANKRGAIVEAGIAQEVNVIPIIMTQFVPIIMPRFVSYPPILPDLVSPRTTKAARERGCTVEIGVKFATNITSRSHDKRRFLWRASIQMFGLDEQVFLSFSVQNAVCTGVGCTGVGCMHQIQGVECGCRI